MLSCLCTSLLPHSLRALYVLGDEPNSSTGTACTLSALLRESSLGLARLEDPDVLAAMLGMGLESVQAGQDVTPVCVLHPE